MSCRAVIWLVFGGLGEGVSLVYGAAVASVWYGTARTVPDCGDVISVRNAACESTSGTGPFEPLQAQASHKYTAIILGVDCV